MSKIDWEQPSSLQLIAVFLLLCAVWILFRLPNIDAPFSLKMDAASAGVAYFIDESWQNNPMSRLGAPVDHRVQWDELNTGEKYPYLHTPPLSLFPLGVWIKCFGLGEISLRLGGIFFSCLAMCFTFLLVQRWMTLKLAIMVVVLMVLCPQSIHYSRNVDPMVTNFFWMPLMWWTYGLYREQQKFFLLWLSISLLAMLSYWNSFGVFASIGCFHLWDLGWKQLDKKEFLWAFILPFMAVVLMLTYKVAVWGSWEAFMEDWNYTVSTRTKSGGATFGVFFKIECQRLFRNYGLSLSLLAVLPLWYIFRKPFPFKINIGTFQESDRRSTHRVMMLLILMFCGAWLFPFWVKRATLVHEYFSIWMLLPLCWLASLGAFCLQSSKLLWCLKGLIVLMLVQSFWVSRNRMLRYDRDYLLSQELGKTIHEHFPDAIFLTDVKDNEHVLQYYSGSDLFLKVDDMEGIVKAMGIYEQSGRTEDLIFVTITVDRVVAEIPRLEGYPEGKFSGEFDLELNRESPFWQSLKRNFPYAEVNGFDVFTLKSAQ